MSQKRIRLGMRITIDIRRSILIGIGIGESCVEEIIVCLVIFWDTV